MSEASAIGRRKQRHLWICADIDYVRSLTEELGVRAELAALADDLPEQSDFLIRGLPVLDEGARSVLEGLVEYASGREY